MKRISGFSSLTALVIALGMTAGAVAPIMISAPPALSATATTAQFSDIKNHWTRPFIEALASGSSPIIHGYGDGTFRPDQPVTRAEFASLIESAFGNSAIQPTRKDQFPFNDVSAKYWAKSSIATAYQTGFMSGYSNGKFGPEQNIPRVQVLVALASGLGLDSPASIDQTLTAYKDTSSIPDYALDKVAAATSNQMVVNYPNVRNLRPNQNATRGEVAAFIYQALVKKGVFTGLSNTDDASQYIVGSKWSSNPINQATRLKVDKGISIPVIYDQNYVVATPNDTVNLTLTVPSNIQNSQGQVVIPQNSQIVGQLIPRYAGNQFLGTQFVAQRLLIGNQAYNNINASSDLISTQQVNQVNPQTVQNAALTAAAQAIISKVNGQKFDPSSILSSVLSGQVVSTPQQQNNVIVINPQKDLKLTVGSDFYVKQADVTAAQ